MESVDFLFALYWWPLSSIRIYSIRWNHYLLTCVITLAQLKSKECKETSVSNFSKFINQIRHYNQALMRGSRSKAEQYGGELTLLHKKET